MPTYPAPPEQSPQYREYTAPYNRYYLAPGHRLLFRKREEDAPHDAFEHRVAQWNLDSEVRSYRHSNSGNGEHPRNLPRIDVDPVPAINDLAKASQSKSLSGCEDLLSRSNATISVEVDIELTLDYRLGEFRTRIEEVIVNGNFLGAAKQTAKKRLDFAPHNTYRSAYAPAAIPAAKMRTLVMAPNLLEPPKRFACSVITL